MTAAALPSAAGVSIARKATVLACAAVLIVTGVFSGNAAAPEAKPQPKPDAKANAKAQAMPAWRKGLKVDVFSPIPGSSPSKFDLDPGYYEGRVFDDWCGLQIDGKRGVIYSALGAGHSSQEQNGVYKQNLMVDKPVWEIVRKSTRYVPGQNGNQPYFPDGRPVARHTYYDGNFVEVGGKGMIIFIQAIAASPASGFFPTTDAFHLDTGDWDLKGSGWQTFPGRKGPNMCVAKDPRTQQIWVADSQGAIFRLDPATKQWTTLTNSFNRNGIGGVGTIVDIKRERLVFAGSWTTGDVIAFGTWNINGGKYEDHPLVWPNGAPQGENLFAGTGLVHDPIKDRYLWLSTTSGKLRAIDPDKFTVTEVAQTEQGGWGIFNRFAYIEALRGCVYLPRFTSEMMFLPLE